jgi:hypothetical protein
MNMECSEMILWNTQLVLNDSVYKKDSNSTKNSITYFNLSLKDAYCWCKLILR